MPSLPRRVLPKFFPSSPLHVATAEGVLAITAFPTSPHTLWPTHQAWAMLWHLLVLHQAQNSSAPQGVRVPNVQLK